MAFRRLLPRDTPSGIMNRGGGLRRLPPASAIKPAPAYDLFIRAKLRNPKKGQTEGRSALSYLVHTQHSLEK